MGTREGSNMYPALTIGMSGKPKNHQFGFFAGDWVVQ
jgi:hypothetical protein